MSTKWKIFLASNFFVALPALVLLLLLIIGLANNRNQGEDYLWGSVFGSALLIVALNSFFNILVIQRYYPDKLIPAFIKTTHVVLMVLAGLTTLGMVVMSIYISGFEFSNDNAGRDMTGKIMLILLFLGLLLEIVILIMQGPLLALISRNNRDKMHSLIDAIGQ